MAGTDSPSEGCSNKNRKDGGSGANDYVNWNADPERSHAAKGSIHEQWWQKHDGLAPDLKMDNCTYTVQFGDSLSTIAKRELATEGKAVDKDSLKAEMDLIISLNNCHYQSLDGKKDRIQTGWNLVLRNDCQAPQPQAPERVAEAPAPEIPLTPSPTPAPELQVAQQAPPPQRVEVPSAQPQATFSQNYPPRELPPQPMYYAAPQPPRPLFFVEFGFNHGYEHPLPYYVPRHCPEQYGNPYARINMGHSNYYSRDSYIGGGNMRQQYVMRQSMGQGHWGRPG